MIRAIVVDDEPLARRRLKALLKDEREIAIVGECEDGPSAIAAVETLGPDLMFLDVQMPGLDGFDVIAALGPRRCPPVVFITAYDQYALKAFEAHAIDYLLKPFERRRLRHAIERARLLAGHAGDLERRLRALVRDASALDRLVVRSQGRVYFVRADDIDWIEASGHYAAVHANGATHLIRETIAALAERLDPVRFVRLHRSAIVNIDRVKEMRPSFHGEYVIVLRDGTRVTSSRGYSAALHRLLHP